MTLLLFSLLLILLCINAPIAIAVGVSAIAVFAAKDMSLMLVVQRLYAGADSFPLMAVPLFMIAGQLMGAGGISRRIVRLADALVGHFRGGLAAVSVVSAMFFAGISGSAAADTAAVGAILIPSMVKRGYTPAFSGAVQAAAGSIGVIIPPSIPMIIYGVLTGVSIGKLFAAGILPGILMGISLIIVASLLANQRQQADTCSAAISTPLNTADTSCNDRFDSANVSSVTTSPSPHIQKRKFSFSELCAALRDAIWSLGAPAIILGGILGGIFTATESAAAAVFYALFVGLFIHKELRFSNIPDLLICATVTSSIIMFIICAASSFSWIMAMQGIPAQLASVLADVTSDPVILLLIINAILLLAGTFLETTAALILLVPVIAPLVPVLGIDPVQLGTIVVLNLAIGMLTPPLGICLIVSCSIANTPLSRMARAVLPFLGILLFDLLLITFWSPLTTWLPDILFQ